jgi:GNAT superfamily N-acetyltransferase
MRPSARLASHDDIVRWRDSYRLEMACQITHDSLHTRKGWSKEYLLRLDHAVVGYGSVVVAGPWSGKPTVYEFFLAPDRPRLLVFELFEALLHASGAVGIVVQSNAPLLAAMLHTFARDVVSEAVLFEDALTTSLRPDGATFREPTPAEAPDVHPDDLRWNGVVEMEGTIAASGGILFHYNPPYGDIFMEVAEPFRRRGLGTFIVQELKRVCYEGGHVPAARCSPDHVASRRALQRAGFVPCGHILAGTVGLPAIAPLR